MTIQTIFLVSIALVVPVFFALLFVTSAYHQLTALRGRCEDILLQAKAVSNPIELAKLRRDYDEAGAAYDAARLRFPGPLITPVFRFAPPKPWPAQVSSAPPSTDTRERRAP